MVEDKVVTIAVDMEEVATTEVKTEAMAVEEMAAAAEQVYIILHFYNNFSQGIINPNPGTVIADEVTGGDDFYLVSIKTR